MRTPSLAGVVRPGSGTRRPIHTIAPPAPQDAGQLPQLGGISVLACSVGIEDFQSNVTLARRGVLTGPEFSRLWGRRRVAFRRWLRHTFDVVIIDCPPSVTRHVEFLLRVCDGIVVPSVPDRLSVRGALQFARRLEDKGIDTPVLGTLWTLFRTQVDTHRDIVNRARKDPRQFGNLLAHPSDTVIPNSAAIASASDPERRGLHVRTLKGDVIGTVADWHALAPPKSDRQWVEGRHRVLQSPPGRWSVSELGLTRAQGSSPCRQNRQGLSCPHAVGRTHLCNSGSARGQALRGRHAHHGAGRARVPRRRHE